MRVCVYATAHGQKLSSAPYTLTQYFLSVRHRQLASDEEREGGVLRMQSPGLPRLPESGSKGIWLQNVHIYKLTINSDKH